MLKNPHAGWMTIVIGDNIIGTVSYLSDVPVIVLESLTRRVRDHMPVNMSFDSEGSTVGLVEFDGELLAIDSGADTPVVRRIMWFGDHEAAELLREAVADVRRQMRAMIDWDAVDHNDDDARDYRRRLLAGLCDDGDKARAASEGANDVI
jgi:hypothetical protein